jgi:hypothetical protein
LHRRSHLLHRNHDLSRLCLKRIWSTTCHAISLLVSSWQVGAHSNQIKHPFL